MKWKTFNKKTRKNFMSTKWKPLTRKNSTRFHRHKLKDL